MISFLLCPIVRVTGRKEKKHRSGCDCHNPVRSVKVTGFPPWHLAQGHLCQCTMRQCFSLELDNIEDRTPTKSFGSKDGREGAISRDSSTHSFKKDQAVFQLLALF